MNPLLITVFGLVSSTLAMPQYGGNGNSGQIGNLNNNNGGQQGGRQPNLPAGCTIQYKTVYDIVENEKFETKCVEKYRYVHIDSFHQCLFNFPFIYQFYFLMTPLVKSAF